MLYEASVRSVVSNTIPTAMKPSEVAVEAEASTSGQGEQVMTMMKRAREEGEKEETALLQPKRKCLERQIK